MAMDIKKKRLFKLDGFIKLLKLISVGVGAFAIAGIAIYYLVSNKPVDEVEETTESLDTLISQLEQAEEEECESCKI